MTHPTMQVMFDVNIIKRTGDISQVSKRIVNEHFYQKQME